MNIGIIGYKGHAIRICDAIKENNINNKIITFHPRKKNEAIKTNNLDDILKSDCIFIASPNDTHFDYITELKFQKGYSGKIFCEKPPVADSSELEHLSQYGENLFRDVYFNFNFRKTSLYKEIKCRLNDLGAVLSVDLSLTHGLAYKDSYINSWRSQSINHSLGVLETVGIHWIDLFISLFGNIKRHQMFNNIIAKTGTAFDTSDLVLLHNSGTVSKIFVSYASCKYFNLKLHCTNGVINFKNNDIFIISPRDVFDSHGNFKYPEKFEFEYSFDRDYRDSLSTSVNYFLSCVEKNIPFKRDCWDRSIESNRVLLTLKNRYDGV